VGTKVWQAPPPGEPSPAGWLLANTNLTPANDDGNGGAASPLRLPVRSIVAIEKGLASDDRVIVVGLQKARPGAPVAPENWELRAPKTANAGVK
jgi:hypothetical protein